LEATGDSATAGDYLSEDNGLEQTPELAKVPRRLWLDVDGVEEQPRNKAVSRNGFTCRLGTLPPAAA